MYLTASIANCIHVDTDMSASTVTKICYSIEMDELIISWNFPSHFHNCTNITNYNVTLNLIISSVNSNHTSVSILGQEFQVYCHINSGHYRQCSTHITISEVDTMDLRYYDIVDSNNCVELTDHDEVTIIAENCINGVGQFHINITTQFVMYTTTQNKDKTVTSATSVSPSSSESMGASENGATVTLNNTVTDSHNHSLSFTSNSIGPTTTSYLPTTSKLL